MTRFTHIFLFLAILLVLPHFVVAQTIHVVLAVDGRAGFGANLATDLRNMQKVFTANVPNHQLELVTLDAAEVTPKTILDAVYSLDVKTDDTVVFYYSGYGANNPQNGGHYLQLRDENGKAVELQRRALLASLQSKSPRLIVILTDSCNVTQVSEEVVQKSSDILIPPDKISPLFESIFVVPSGVVDMNSSQKGEVSFVDASPKRRGSCFTYPFAALLEARKDETATWPEIVEQLKKDVQKAFEESWPDGYKSDSPQGGPLVQRTQNVEVFGSLPGETTTLRTGPRFGVRAVAQFGGGVRITELYPNGPGMRAGFEIGDIILEINDKPISTEKEYSDAIDDSPKKMKAKVINVNDRQELTIRFDLGY